MADKEETVAVFKALENEDYKWRTINGISKETKLPVDVIIKVIEENRDRIISPTALSNKGERLFASRDKYLKKATAAQRFVSAIKNRIEG